MDEGRVIVSISWLADHLGDAGLRILDGSWHLPPERRDAAAEFLTEHIPGAQFFDIDRIADTSQGLPHMLPADALFAATVAGMGIENASRVVVYDSKGLFSAPRVWWTLRVMGLADVAVLDGGLPAWKAGGRPLEAGPARPRPPAHFTVRRETALVRSLGGVRTALADHSVQVVDARPAGRFTGEEPEPRPGLARGHMPGARNVPFSQLVGPDGLLKSEPELRAVFAAAGVDPQAPAVASCGSGVSAAVVALALAMLGNDTAAVYDGSWAEWGRDPANAIATGPAA